MPEPMTSPVVTFLYVLMRDHLPTGTVKYLIEQSQRAGDPAYSAPELEALAKRYADELLLAPPRAPAEPEKPEEPASAPPEPEPAAKPPPPAAKARVAAVSKIGGHVGAATVTRTREWIIGQGRARLKPSDLDALGYSSATRARVIRNLREEGFLDVEYEGHQRVLVVLGGGAKTSEPDHDDAGKGAKPDDPAGDTGERDHDDDGQSEAPPAQTAREDRGSDGDGRESGSAAAATNGSAGGRGQAVSRSRPADATPGGAPADDLTERIAAYVDDAEDEVWPRELESHFDISTFKRLKIIDALMEGGRIVTVGGGGPNTRYRSSKKTRSVPAARRNGGEAAEPAGTGPSHFRDTSAEQRKAAKAERKAADDIAAKVLPAVREWVLGAGTFSPRQLRDLFDLEPAACTRVLATLSTEGLIRRVGESHAETYEAVTTNDTHSGGPRGKRPLHAGGGGATLEGRAIGLLDGDGLTIAGLAGRLGVSDVVAKAVLGKLYREGEVRPRKRGGELHYAACA